MSRADDHNNSLFVVHRQYIKDLSFEYPNPFLDLDNKQPNLSVDIQAKAEKLVDSTFEVVLQFNIATKVDDEHLFIIELLYGSVVTTDESIVGESLSQLLLVQIPYLLFPYARNIVSNLVSECGLPPLYLSPVDFSAIYKNNTEEIAGNA